MNIRRKWLANFGAMAIISPLLLEAEPVQAQGIGQKLLLFPAPTLSGEMLDPSAYDQKVTLMYSWASWCPFCLRDLPVLRDKLEEHKAKGFAILGINLDADPDLALKWVATHKVNFPSIRPTPEYLQAYMPKRKVTPAWWLANREGIVIDASMGQGAEFVYRGRKAQIDKAVES